MINVWQVIKQLQETRHGAKFPHTENLLQARHIWNIFTRGLNEFEWAGVELGGNRGIPEDCVQTAAVLCISDVHNGEY